MDPCEKKKEKETRDVKTRTNRRKTEGRLTKERNGRRRHIGNTLLSIL